MWSSSDLFWFLRSIVTLCLFLQVDENISKVLPVLQMTLRSFWTLIFCYVPSYMVASINDSCTDFMHLYKMWRYKKRLPWKAACKKMDNVISVLQFMNKLFSFYSFKNIQWMTLINQFSKQSKKEELLVSTFLILCVVAASRSALHRISRSVMKCECNDSQCCSAIRYAWKKM